MEWWFNNSGENLLKGVEGDESNPIRLSENLVVYFLRLIPEARESFNRVVPTMLEEEQLRLQAMAATSAKFMLPDYKKTEDDFQSRQNKAGVRTSGRYGGTRRGGNL